MNNEHVVVRLENLWTSSVFDRSERKRMLDGCSWLLTVVLWLYSGTMYTVQMKVGGSWSVGFVLFAAAVLMVAASVAVSGVNAMERHTNRHSSHRHRGAMRHWVDKRPPDLKSYHSAAQLTAKFQALSANCPHLKIGTKKGDKKSLLTVTISRPDKPKNGAVSDEKLKVLMFFGEHARELISPEVGAPHPIAPHRTAPHRIASSARLLTVRAVLDVAMLV